VRITCLETRGGQSGLPANCRQAARRLPVATVNRSISRTAALEKRTLEKGDSQPPLAGLGFRPAKPRAANFFCQRQSVGTDAPTIAADLATLCRFFNRLKSTNVARRCLEMAFASCLVGICSLIWRDFFMSTRSFD